MFTHEIVSLYLSFLNPGQSIFSFRLVTTSWRTSGFTKKKYMIFLLKGQAALQGS